MCWPCCRQVHTAPGYSAVAPGLRGPCCRVRAKSPGLPRCDSRGTGLLHSIPAHGSGCCPLPGVGGALRGRQRTSGLHPSRLEDFLLGGGSSLSLEVEALLAVMVVWLSLGSLPGRPRGTVRGGTTRVVEEGWGRAGGLGWRALGAGPGAVGRLALPQCPPPPGPSSAHGEVLGCSLGEGGPALYTETCARMPRHVRTQTGTRVIICDAGWLAPVMVLSLAGLTFLPPEEQVLGRGRPDARVMNPFSRRSPPHFLIAKWRCSVPPSLPARCPQARGHRAGGSVGRDLLFPGRASPSRTHSGNPAGGASQ